MKFFNYKQFVLNEDVNLKNSYVLNLDWWTVWKGENESKYNITLNAVDKSYTVKDKKTDNIIFIYDYNRQKAFTNKKPSFFDIKNTDISPEELNKELEKEQEKLNPQQEEEETKKEDPLSLETEE